MFDGLTPALRSTIPARLELDPLDPINRGLVGFWPLTEPGGTVFRDLSPFNRRASGVNTPTRAITQRSRATSFNAASSQSVSTGITNFSPTAGSVVWFHRTAVAYNSGTIRGIWGQVPGWEFSAQVYLDNNWYIGWRNPAGDKRIVTAATAANWPTNTVTAYVFTYDASGAKLYVNGALVASNATAQSPSDMGTSFLFGSQGTATYFTGDMFGARLIARALVPSEVQRISLDPWAGAFDPADRLFHAFKAPTGVTVALTGVAATGAVGTVGPQTAVAASGVAGTGEVGTVVPGLALALTGVEGLAVVGDVGIGGDKTVALTGVEATGAVGDVVGVLGGVSGTLRRRGRYRVYRNVPVELAPAVDLAAGYVEAEVERAVEDAMRRLRALSLKASVARRTALVQELNTQIVAAVARAAEADEEDAIALL